MFSTRENKKKFDLSIYSDLCFSCRGFTISMKILFLDDRYSDRTWIFLKDWLPRHIMDVITTTSAEETIRQLVSSKFTHVFLDKDLDWNGRWKNVKSGMDVVDGIIAHMPQIGKIIIHSTNTIDPPKMYKRLKDAGYNVILCPFEDEMVKKHWSEIL